MADLRLARSEIDGIAADGADRAVDASCALIRTMERCRLGGARMGISHARG